MSPQLIFGTATFGGAPPAFETASSIDSLLSTLQTLNITHLDTAARYPPTSPGRSEELIGEVAPSVLSGNFQIDTKCLVDTATDGSGDLSAESMNASVETSLARMKRDSVDVLYAHRPDPATPLEQQIRNFHAMIEGEKCQAWGVSNFPPSTMQDLLRICDEKGLRKPKYYQGVYNPIARAMETKLLPLLRAHGVAFIGYAPLAAGFMTGNLTNSTTDGTRFSASNPIGARLGPRFASSTKLAAAMQRFDVAAKSLELTPAEVSLRWLAHHSALQEQDGIILGASSEAQVVKSVEGIRKGELRAEVVELVETLWREVEGEKFEAIWGNGMDG